MTKIQEEARRLYTIYNEFKDSEDDLIRRKVHVDLDRFLMENRDIAIEAILNMKRRKKRWLF